MIKVFQADNERLSNEGKAVSFMFGMGTSFKPAELFDDYYVHVADLDCDDLNDAFEIGNIGPEEKYTRYERMHSVSVGDVLEKDGVKYVVASFGFEELA